MSHIDLILWGNTKGAIATFARNNPPNNPLLDADGNVRPGVRYCWWGGDGKMKSPSGEIPGFVMLLRLHTVMYEADKLTPAEGETEQFHKSKVAKYIANNGTFGRTSEAYGNLPYYELDGVRIFRPQNVDAWLAANDLPGHTWVGGNAY